METKKIIEINGVKMELDYRTAQTTQVDTYKVGDKVKVLVKEYGDNFRSFAGAIVGFDNFKERPTIVVMYIVTDYSVPEIKTVYIHKDSEHEIVLANYDDFDFSKEFITDRFDRLIEAKKIELTKAESHKKSFLKYFDKKISLLMENKDE